ncbi:MAG: KamA family radical SAM protein [Sphaerochaetaceae bacterium]|jgi:lysine 2,3-aminomutase
MTMDNAHGGSISSLDSLATRLSLTDDELKWREDGLTVPLLIPEYYFALIDSSDPADPLRRQVVPTRFENIPDVGEDSDPQQERSYSVTARLIHRYRNRVAFLVTDLCPMYCRHCFRRRFTGKTVGPATDTEIETAAAYIGDHLEIKEILLTGGDLLTLSDTRLERMIAIFRRYRPDLVMRLCTRTPASWPQRITDDLISVFKRNFTAPYYLMTQFNHPKELTTRSVAAVAKFVDAGIPAMNQTVLLRGVNDDADVLEELCDRLVASRIKPYYLFQGDLVTGTAHFRVPLEEGLRLEQELRRRLSGLAMPVYAVDLPQGGGKVPLSHCYLQGRDADGAWLFSTPDGELRRYPDPEVAAKHKVSETT